MLPLRAQRGFTLVELLVGVTISIVLAGLSLASFTELKQKAYDASAQSKVKNLGLACEALINDFLVDPAGATAEYNLITHTDAGGNIQISGISGCVGAENCGTKLPGMSTSEGVVTGYSIAGSNADVEMSNGWATVAGSGGGSSIDCVALAYHRKGTKTFYWIPRLGLYSTPRTGPASWCSFVPAGMMGC